jgi:hypothetical protein
MSEVRVLLGPRITRGRLAQLVERLFCKQEVRSSILLLSTPVEKLRPRVVSVRCRRVVHPEAETPRRSTTTPHRLAQADGSVGYLSGRLHAGSPKRRSDLRNLPEHHPSGRPICVRLSMLRRWLQVRVLSPGQPGVAQLAEHLIPSATHLSTGSNLKRPTLFGYRFTAGLALLEVQSLDRAALTCLFSNLPPSRTRIIVFRACDCGVGKHVSGSTCAGNGPHKPP